MGLPAKVFFVLIGIIVVFNLLFLDAQWAQHLQLGLSERIRQLEEQVNFLALMRATVAEEPRGEEVVSLAKPIVVTPVAMVEDVVREVWLPLGSGSTSSLEWADTGAQAYIDTMIYLSLKEAYFQASLKSNSGTVYVRL